MCQIRATKAVRDDQRSVGEYTLSVIIRSRSQPFVYHRGALPISAVFRLRYLRNVVRMWAAPDPLSKLLDMGSDPAEW